MHMRRGEPGYAITERRSLIAEPGTELLIKKMLPGIRQLSGEKIQWYLASELRDRIRKSGVQIRVVDRTARAEFNVEPRQFEGRLLHHIGKTIATELYCELYLTAPAAGNAVGLYRQGTRVLENLAHLGELNRSPWTSGYLQGIVDAPFLNLTPGTRTGLLQDEFYVRFLKELEPIEQELRSLIEEQQRAEEERTSREVLRTIQRALREALLALPAEEYDWFQVHGNQEKRSAAPGPGASSDPASVEAAADSEAPEGAALVLAESPPEEEPAQKQFFEFAGPLYSVRIAPSSSTLPVCQARLFRAVARDRARRLVEQDLTFEWEILEGQGMLEDPSRETVVFSALQEPGLVRVKVTVRQGELVCTAEALITVTDTLVPGTQLKETTKQGIPSYTFQKAPGELWRVRFDVDQNLIVINNGHRDFVFASRHQTLKLRYIARLFAKELVLKNFPGVPQSELLERLIELSLYTEEHLK
ncbi:MAG: hypothetical protein U1G07_14945 [Verrucomicrobiota bacterium]